MSDAPIQQSPEHDPTESALEELMQIEVAGERAKFFQSHEDLINAATAERLATEVTNKLQVDLAEAKRIAACLRWLAEELDDDYWRGRSDRCEANLLFLVGHWPESARSYESAWKTFQRLGSDLDAAITSTSGLTCLSYLGEHERAKEWTDFARSTFERKGDRLRLARLEFNYANIMFRRDRWEEAAVGYRDAYAELRSIGNPQDVAICLSNMALCHQSLQGFSEAYSLYQQARDFCVANDLTMLIADIDYNIAYLFFLRGEYTEALDRYREAKETCKRHDREYRLHLCRLDEAEIYLELNLTEESIELARQAYSGFENLKITYESGKSMVLWAIALSRQGKWFLALEILTEARKIFSREQNTVWIQQIDLHSALVLYRAGRPFEAASHAKDALLGFDELGLQTKASVCELLLSRTYADRQEWRRAEEAARSALQRLQGMDVPAVEYQAHFTLGEIHESSGRTEAALDDYLRAHERLEKARSHIQSEELKVPLLEDKLLVYERLVSLLYAGPSARDTERAFQFIEKAKARSISDLVASRAHALPTRVSGRSNLASAVRDLREQLNWYYRQIDLQEMRGDGSADQDLSPLREASKEHEGRLLHSLGQLRATDQELSSLQEAFTVDLPAIRSTLAHGTVMLDYYIAGKTILVAVLGRETLEILPISIVSRVQELWRSLRFQLAKFEIGLEDPDAPSQMVDSSVRQFLHALYVELMAPVAHLVEGYSLLVMPHGFLHHVPFHALWDGEAYLCDKYSIAYSPSATVSHLIGLRPAPMSRGTLVLGGIPAAYSEAEAMAASLPDAQLLSGEDAKEDVLKQLAPGARYVHISSRGSFREDNAMFSSIELEGSSLNLFDFFNLRLDTEVFSLTGCGPALTSDPKGDAFLGLTRGLLYAGARSVLTTLWNIDKACAVGFVSRFYHRLQEGEEKAEALRETMLEERVSNPNPFRWAPFVLVGDAFSR